MECLDCRSNGVYVDGTVGGGGHAADILERTGPGGLLVGIDRDEAALRESRERLRPFGDRVVLVRGNFSDIGGILAGLKIARINGLLLDLGVSSHQLDRPERGFSFSREAPLDMRMDEDSRLTAADIVNGASQGELEKMLREYGEEHQAAKIARAILRRRGREQIRTTTELAALVAGVLSRTGRPAKIHPATRTFQALRIAVNAELTSLHRGLSDGIEMLAKGGRVVVISFHSLEDRIVKNIFRTGEKGCICPPGLPVCTCGREKSLKIVTRKPVEPGEMELRLNPRARSARLRAAERI